MKIASFVRLYGEIWSISVASWPFTTETAKEGAKVNEMTMHSQGLTESEHMCCGCSTFSSLALF